MNILKRLWNDESGAILSTEMVVITSTVGVGTIAGFSMVRDSINNEMSDVANALGRINQNYSYSGVNGHSSGTAGSANINHENRNYCIIVEE